MFISTNPVTEEVIFEFQLNKNSEILEDLTKAHQSYCSWKKLSIENRISFIPKLIQALEKNKRSFAKNISLEVGKPIVQSIAEIEKCILLCEYYFQNSQELLANQVFESEWKESKIIYQPLGIILGIMPWNFPFWQVFRFAIPTIISGNVVFLKHAPNVGRCAQEIEMLFINAGLEGVYTNIFIENEQCELILSDRRVAGVSLTGSSKAGSIVASLAAKYLKPQVLELGGSDVFVLDESANLDQAIENAVITRTQNSGQSCIAGKRFLVHENVYSLFLNKLTDKLKTIKIGDSLSTETNIGPLARKDLKQLFETQIAKGKAQGAKLLFQMKSQQEKGFFVDLEVLEIENLGNILFQEEIFGPCFVLKKIKSFAESIEIANNSIYGLSASVWTNSIENQNEAIESIESGAVFINKMSKSEPRFSFGGIKDSGYGRELGEEGLKSFVNKKLVLVN